MKDGCSSLYILNTWQIPSMMIIGTWSRLLVAKNGEKSSSRVQERDGIQENGGQIIDLPLSLQRRKRNRILLYPNWRQRPNLFILPHSLNDQINIAILWTCFNSLLHLQWLSLISLLPPWNFQKAYINRTTFQSISQEEIRRNQETFFLLL